MKRLVVGLLGVLLVVVGCARTTEGSPVAGQRDVDPAVFFAGAVPTYGQPLNSAELATQADLRAIRRLDPCGFARQDVLSGIGDVVSAGTMFDFNACELEIKVAGSADPKLISVTVAMTDFTGDAPAFTVGNRPVYPYDDASCGYQVPLPLDRLPGAPAAITATRPYLQISELMPERGCGFVEEFTKTVVARMDPARLPLRDALAVYPIRAAERDPCAVLAGMPDLVSWDATAPLPYVCAFTLQRSGFRVNARLVMKPRSPKQPDDGFFRDERDGVEVYDGQEYCAAIAFLGAELKVNTMGGAGVDMGEFATAPAVTVNVDAPHCDAATELAVAAAKAFG
jgi:hypothetical protein